MQRFSRKSAFAKYLGKRTTMIYTEEMEEVDISVDLIFDAQGPKFGDLFTICGYENPNFPPEGNFDFKSFDALQFSQVDDYFGVRTTSGVGDDVAVWLYPMVNGKVVDHHPGPFDGLRISYNVLRNPIERSQHFVFVIEQLSQKLAVKVKCKTATNDMRRLRQNIQVIADFWANQGIEVGSDAALEMDF